jgi:hypothetical protein
MCGHRIKEGELFLDSWGRLSLIQTDTLFTSICDAQSRKLVLVEAS